MKKKKKTNKFLETIKYIAIGILVIILVLNVYLLIQTKVNPDSTPSIFGYKPYIVMSGSMEKTMSSGDLVIVKETEIEKINIGDIIAYRDSDDNIITHRVVEKLETAKGMCFRTKGDNNNTIDEDLACKEDIEGSFARNYKGVGKILLFVQNPIGFAVIMLAIIIICILIYMNADKEKRVKVSQSELDELNEYKKTKEKKTKAKEPKEKKQKQKQPQRLK